MTDNFKSTRNALGRRSPNHSLLDLAKMGLLTLLLLALNNISLFAGLVEKYGVGGIIFFQGGPVRQAHMINQFQQLSKVPLMISLDGEWGLKMRLDSTVRFPYQMALGGVDDEKLIYDMGAEVARQAKRAGINVNFAPVVDVNNNANNPVIGFRSFGEEKANPWPI